MSFEVTSTTDWLEVSGATELIDSYPGGEAKVYSYLMDGTFGYIDSVIETTGLVPFGSTVVDARMLPANGIPGERLRLWIKLGPA